MRFQKLHLLHFFSLLNSLNLPLNWHVHYFLAHVHVSALICFGFLVFLQLELVPKKIIPSWRWLENAVYTHSALEGYLRNILHNFKSGNISQHPGNHLGSYKKLESALGFVQFCLKPLIPMSCHKLVVNVVPSLLKAVCLETWHLREGSVTSFNSSLALSLRTSVFPHVCPITQALSCVNMGTHLHTYTYLCPVLIILFTSERLTNRVWKN